MRNRPTFTSAALLAGVLSALVTLAVFGCHDRGALRPANTPPRNVTPPVPAPRVDRHGESWSLVSPRGEPFFSLGVSVVDRGASRSDYDTENPAYAAWQHYRDDAAWADATLARLQKWGFTTVGGWGDFKTLSASKTEHVWFMPVLHVGSTAGAPWFDMWDPKVIARMDEVARRQIVPLRDDPRLVGYYTDNELGWWNAALFKMTLEHKPTSGQRRRLIALLREHYGNDWERLRHDFDAEGRDGTEAINDWPGLERGGLLYIRPGGAGIVVMRRFLAMAADRYYQLTRDIVRKYDRRALILGDRYASFYYPEVARAAAPYVDVVSTNLNAAWNDGTFPRFHLDTLHRLTGKPILVSEFYMAAADNRGGNRNTHGVYPVVATQTERAAGMGRTLDALLRLPYVVGAEWFQYYDEARHGRFDGENFNFGLVDTADRPYDEITSVTANLRPIEARARTPQSRPDARGGIPPAPPDTAAHFSPNTALLDWDRERGFVPPASEFPLADLYACWSPGAVYLGVFCQDVVENDYYRGNTIPKQDRMLWTVRAGERVEPIRVRMGADREAIPSDPSVRLWHLSSPRDRTRTVAVIELPAAMFAKQQLSPGDRVSFSSGLRTHGGAYEMNWSGDFTLAQ